MSLRPLVEVSRARGDTPFEFEAPDESFGFPLLRSGALAIGPAIGFEGERKASDIGAALPKVGFTFEVGAFVQYRLAEPVRARLEVRKGLGGHKGWIGILSADYIARDKDRWLLSLGPRLTFSDRRYNRAYFDVTPAGAAASGLPAFSAEEGLEAIGVAGLFLRQLSPRWGVYTYGKYDRLVGDAGRSPIVRRFGSRDQFSGGLALTYTFGGARAR
jgi:outer membrane protein